MSVISKFYFHDAASGNTGTLPGASTLDAATPEWTATGAATNRDMNGTIGVSQVSIVGTCLANTNPQEGWFRRFLSTPIAAQTIAAQTLTLSVAGAESNGNSQFQGSCGVWVWRPSDGTEIGTILAVNTLVTAEFGTTQTALSNTATSTSVTAIAGDILVVEFWRNNTAQLMGTAYTNTFFYDGTTEASATSCASFLSFTTAITMDDEAPPRVPRSTPYPQLLAN